MAKNNNKPRRQQPPQPSFFMQQRQRYGEDFMHFINGEIIKKNGLKIFKDLAYGAILPANDFVYFNEYNFTSNLRDAAKTNAEYNWYCYLGLMNSPGIGIDTNIQQIAAEHYEQFTVYNDIVVHLNNILNGITMYNGIYTAQYLEQLIGTLRWKKRVFNGYYITIVNEEDHRPKRRELGGNSNDQGFGNQTEGGFFGSPH